MRRGKADAIALCVALAVVLALSLWRRGPRGWLGCQDMVL